ncbi:MAG: GAF domain-containing protein [Anaerolineae bacterium]|nr:GAF domain-containing protein [Anaerolineae bacterium]MDW7991728.1 GAF domain-containing protein [Anaerolineae bacterium]
MASSGGFLRLDAEREALSGLEALQAWQARALNVLLGVLALVATPALIAAVAEAFRYPERRAALSVFGALYVFLLLLALFRRIPHRIRLYGLLILGYVLAITALLRGGLVGDGRLYLVVLPIFALIFADLRLGLWAGAFSLLIHLVFALFAALGWLSQWVVVKENPTAPTDWIYATVVFLMMLAGLLVLVGFFNRVTLRTLRSTQRSAQELAKAYSLLEGQAREQERRARWLEVATLVIREASRFLDPDASLSHSADEMVRRLNLEGVIFYLATPQGELVAHAIAEGHPEPGGIAPPGPSPMAREAFRSGTLQMGWIGSLYEVSIPLRVQERTLGVMAVWFPTEVRQEGPEVVVLELVADQLSIILENARVFSETQASLRELQDLYRRYTAEAWERFARIAPESVRLWTGPEEVPEGVWQGLFEQARALGSAVTGQEDSRYLLAVPVKLRGVTIGVLGFHRDQEAGPWRAEEIVTAQMVAERLALSIENARLLEEAQRRAARERLAAEIMSRIRASLDPDTVLKTTVRELGRALRARWAAVEVTELPKGTSSS